MLRNYDELENYLLSNKVIKKLVLVGAQDIYALSSLVQAKRKGIVHGILVGDKNQIISKLCILGEPNEDYEIINVENEEIGIQLSIQLLENGKADLLMKKCRNHLEFKKTMKNCKQIIKTNSILSECSIFENKNLNKLITVTDRSINFNPDLKEKMKIMRNAVELAKSFNPKYVKVFTLSSSNQENLVSNDIDAHVLSTIEVKDCVIEGPYTINKVITKKAKENKNTSDVFLCSDFETGNEIYNSLKCSSDNKNASILCGAKYPIIISSMLDNTVTQYYSILVGLLQSIKKEVLI